MLVWVQFPVGLLMGIWRHLENDETRVGIGKSGGVERKEEYVRVRKHGEGWDVAVCVKKGTQ